MVEDDLELLILLSLLSARICRHEFGRALVFLSPLVFFGALRACHNPSVGA